MTTFIVPVASHSVRINKGNDLYKLASSKVGFEIWELEYKIETEQQAIAASSLASENPSNFAIIDNKDNAVNMKAPRRRSTR